MINFFRKTRQKLANENRFLKYWRYAIGEIVLVVVGILIALQINNWNEARKRTRVEINTLTDLKTDLQENINNLEQGILTTKKSLKENLELINRIQSKSQFDKSLPMEYGVFLGVWEPDFIYASFENLKSVGVSLISNKSLRKKIIDAFEIKMEILDVSDMKRIDNLNLTMVLPIQKKYFHRDFTSTEEQWKLIPTNYDSMMADPEFFNVCTEMAFRQQRSINRFMEFNKSARALIEEIDAELAKLNS